AANTRCSRARGTSPPKGPCRARPSARAATGRPNSRAPPRTLLTAAAPPTRSRATAPRPGAPRSSTRAFARCSLPLPHPPPPQEPPPHRLRQHVPRVHQHILQPFAHPASHHHGVVAEAHHTAMSARFYTLDVVHEHD